jgi:site-specific DNA-methyltransferase (adenine-specific)
MTVQLFCGDCLEIMPKLADKSIDAVICDPPYGTTACKWDSVIPFAPMWEQLKRIIKQNRAISLFSSQPFTSALVMSNPKMFRYQWVWDKKIPSGMTYSRFQPMRQHEDILVFSTDNAAYYPQIILRDKPIKSGGQKNLNSQSTTIDNYKVDGFKRTYEFKNPTTILTFDKVRKDSVHPTQKPVELMEYLIKTYTQERETVLDFTCGSGSTGVAAVNLGRSFIGIEKDPRYFEIAKERIAEAERRKNNEFFVKKPTAPTLFDFMLEDKQ